MDFSLSAEQERLKKEFQRFLKNECPKDLIRELEAGELGYSQEIWKKTAALGWQGLIIPEEYNGEGGDLMDLAVLFEEIGRSVFPSPMFSTVLYGVIPLIEGGSEDQKREILPKVAAGDSTLTMAFSEPETDFHPQFLTTAAQRDQGGYIINGTKMFVQNAHIANHQLVVAKTGDVTADNQGVSIFLVKKGSEGMSLTPLKTVAGDKQSEVIFKNVAVTEQDILGDKNSGWPILETALSKATAIQCVQTVGVMQQALAMTAEYTSSRVQFNRPIGSFQAVQHRLADMLTDVDGARLTSYRAVGLLSKGQPALREVAIAKAWTSDACQRVAYAAQHLHGGIGMDLSYDLHFYFRWAKSMALNLGPSYYHLPSINPLIRAAQPLYAVSSTDSYAMAQKV